MQDKALTEKLKFILEARKLNRKELEAERGEFERYGDADKEIAAAMKGRGAEVRSLKGVGNTDVPDIEKGDLRSVIKKLKSYGRSKDRIRKAYDSVKADTDDPSIVRISGTGKKEKRTLVAGNTRAMIRKALGKKIKVHVYKTK